MPIKGLSEVVRLPRLGKIRLGVKKENAEGIFYPESTDYFVCPDEVKDVFGEKPKELRIMFPTDDETQWASQFLRCYSADGSLVCRGDGEMALARVETNTNEPGATTSKLIEMPCSPFRCPCHQQGYCRRVMNLQFLLPDCPGFGVYQLDTGSLYSIININSSLKLIRGICGRLSMIPLSLKLIEQDVLPEGKKKTIKILSLTAPYSIAEIQKYAQIPPGQALLLPVPDSEAPDDLFPPEILKQQKPAKQSEEVDKRLINLWTRVKSKVWQMDMQDYQVSHWFQKNCNLDVHITDFDLLTPPNRIKAEYLENFLKTLERYTDRS
ncbi:hypothetical protein B1778_00670 [Dehalococcoides mccartyi]|uniref:recombination directionality factor n=1 Tax=Dehalococcoides mccartyi TaxID=61435 RepID=UPI00098F331C|nr:hypothetical protein B1777_00815 [Dehalococcoides mccartyi]AQU06743.1 hypothetical protein B1778_00670 [Dehalococcoides mccartyi]